MGRNGHVHICIVGCGRVVGIATRYGLDCLEIELLWGRNFPHPSRPTVEPTQPFVQWGLLVFREGKTAGARP